MKKIISILVFLVAISGVVSAQSKDGVDPLITVNKDNLNFTIGGRLMMDAGWLHSEFTNMKSGAKISSARIRTGLKFGQWDLFADFDFAGGKVKQKNIYAKYTFANVAGNQMIKIGYFNEPSTMSRNTSSYSYHFMSRPSSSYALSVGRALGVTYKFYNNRFFADQGIFSENKDNDQIAGNQGIDFSGRWLYKVINNDNMVLHVGATFKYSKINTGIDDNDIFKTNLDLESSLGTSLDDSHEFLNAEMPFASSSVDCSAEALFMTNKFFIRGEYMSKEISKDRPDNDYFIKNLANVWSWTTLESWQAGNLIKANHFDGGYVEVGYMIFGGKYNYNQEYSVLSGNKYCNSLEVVARFNHTNLNDINDGEFFLYGKKKFYQGGKVSDYPPVSSSVAGGRVNSYTCGLNYTMNQYVKFSVNYTYNHLNNPNFPMDDDFQFVQCRLAFSF